MTAMDRFVSSLRPSAVALPESGIVRVMNYGRDREGIIPLWAGEGDVPTPDFVCDAACRSMRAGETFYTHQRGIPELRAAIAAYQQRLTGRPQSPESVFVTGSGMQAVQTAIQAVAGPGDEVVIPTPAWPNFAAAAQISGATPVPVPFDFGPDGWRLDLERLTAACGPRTRALFVNSPANPTGWTASRAEVEQLLALARARGLWLIADEVYGRYHYAGGLAPSFLEAAAPEDRLLLVNTFSKNWCMTGWRMGWLTAPAEIGQVIENLIQYNTSGVAVFMQRAGIAAIEQGEAFVAEQIARAAEGRRIACEALQPLNRARFAWPDGAFYLLFGIEGHDDTDTLALRLVDEASIGLAPGTAFGPGGESFLRMCFARSAESLGEAMARLTRWIAAN